MILSRTLLTLAVLIEFCSPLQASGWGELSGHLAENMTEQQVVTALGHRPNKVELQTCGSKTSEPWTCKIYTFGEMTNNIKVLFQKIDGAYLVNSWTVFP